MEVFQRKETKNDLINLYIFKILVGKLWRLTFENQIETYTFVFDICRYVFLINISNFKIFIVAKLRLKIF